VLTSGRTAFGQQVQVSWGRDMPHVRSQQGTVSDGRTVNIETLEIAGPRSSGVWGPLKTAAFCFRLNESQLGSLGEGGAIHLLCFNYCICRKGS
jgi:hypothetical protein